jgi:hypothetical protein
MNWPYPESAAHAWRDFVIAAYQSKSAIDPDEFQKWLVEAGWSQDAARAIVDRFFTDVNLLSEYDDIRQSA